MRGAHCKSGWDERAIQDAENLDALRASILIELLTAADPIARGAANCLGLTLRRPDRRVLTVGPVAGPADSQASIRAALAAANLPEFSRA
jgi:hypothetical protein